LRTLLTTPILFIALLYSGDSAFGGISLLNRARQGDLGSGIDMRVDRKPVAPGDCKPTQPSAMQPGQLERLGGTFLKILEQDDSFTEVWGSMGDCYQAKHISDNSRKSTRDFLETKLEMKFLLLDDQVKRFFNLPEDPSNKSWANIPDPVKQGEKKTEALDHDAKERFLNIAFLARTALGEIMYKQNCGQKDAPIAPWGMGLTRVIVNREDLIKAKANYGRTNFTHFLQDESGKYPSRNEYQPSLSSMRDLLMAFKQFSVWNPNDSNRHKILCPAKESGQIVAISEDEYQHNLRKEIERATRLQKPRRPVYRFTKLNKEHSKDWQMAVKFAYSAVLNREGFKRETSGISPDSVFYTSTTAVHENWAKQPNRYAYASDARVGQTPLADPNCLSIWKPQKTPSSTKK